MGNSDVSRSHFLRWLDSRQGRRRSRRSVLYRSIRLESLSSRTLLAADFDSGMDDEPPAEVCPAYPGDVESSGASASSDAQPDSDAEADDDEPSKGSETKPSNDPDRKPPGKDPKANDVEEKAADEINDEGYTIEHWQKPHPEGDEKDEYGEKEPDFKIEGEFFDLYSPPGLNNPTSTASHFDGKFSEQCSRVVLEIPDGATRAETDALINAIQSRRDTPDTGTRTQMEELIFLMPDGSVEQMFAGRIR